jgi:hypothetical protein
MANPAILTHTPSFSLLGFLSGTKTKKMKIKSHCLLLDLAGNGISDALAFPTAAAPLISPRLCGPPTGLTNEKKTHFGSDLKKVISAAANPNPLFFCRMQEPCTTHRKPNLGRFK